MRILISFFLSFFFYSLIVLFFILILKKPHSSKEVIIHTAIVIPNKPKSIVNNNSIKKSKIKAKKEIKKLNKRNGSKSNFTHGGDVDFSDIFKNVNYNIKTKKLHQKKQLDMSRFKGIEKNLKKIKLISSFSYINSGSSINDKEIENLIAKKLSPIWDLISNVAGEYAKINIIYDGSVRVTIIDSNLPAEKQELLIEKIRNLHFDKNFNITVKFVTKVNK